MKRAIVNRFVFQETNDVDRGDENDHDAYDTDELQIPLRKRRKLKTSKRRSRKIQRKKTNTTVWLNVLLLQSLFKQHAT